jgi:molybdopterin-containing oxidoreductase family iron-sulfur binding subunit
MVIDLDRCTACQACVVACRQENNVPFTEPDGSRQDHAIFWMQVLTIVEDEYPDVYATFIPRPCMHCAHPACIKVCPVGATYQNEEGLVAQIYSRCIGCRYCTVACPYTVRSFNWRAPSIPAPLDRVRNSDVSVRPKGVVEKCTFCIQRIRAAKEKARSENRALRDGEPHPKIRVPPPRSASATFMIAKARSTATRAASAPSGSSRTSAPSPRSTT